jgi:glycosyltransferase involved in cell wall biosynthesis
VEFAGEEKNIELALAQADLLVSTSEFEGFGLAPLEAMACSVPVVATRAGGISEVVEDGVTGRLVEVGDVDGLAARMGEIAEDSALARRFGEAGRERASRVFGTERIVPKYERLYERLLRRTARPAGAFAHA